MKRVLVTGGAGFLGSHLCDRLIEEGNDVICADNLFTGSKDNIRHLLSNPYFEFIRHDITEPLYVEVVQIYNLACPASPVHYQYNPIKTAKTSIIGAFNMLGLAKRVKARILQASTSEVYGVPDLLIPSGSVPAMTRENGWRKRSFSIITGSTKSISASFGFSIRMDRE